MSIGEKPEPRPLILHVDSETGQAKRFAEASSIWLGGDVHASNFYATGNFYAVKFIGDVSTETGDFSSLNANTINAGTYLNLPAFAGAAGYATTASLNATLANYATTVSLNATLLNYATTVSLNATLANYATTSTLVANYPTKTFISQTYATTASLNETLLNNYATKDR